MATMKEVAEHANVSTATVSYVLNGTGTVTEATRQRVLAAVAKLNYQPNYAARSMRGRSHTLGIVLPALSTRLSDPTLSEVLAGLSEAAAAQGYYLLLATASEEQAEQWLAEQLVRIGRVDGLVLLDVLVEDERIRYLREQDVPLVCAGPPPAGVDCAFVTVDRRGGAMTAMQHLIGLGHRRVGLIMLPSDLAASDPCYQGYVEALATIGVPFDPSLAVEAGRSQADGVTAMEELLSLPERPTAVLACSDELALGAMHALYDAGLAVGPDVSLVGFDDVPMAAHTHPPLTTLRSPRHALGQHLARLLIDNITGQSRDQHSMTLAMRLIVRKSTQAV